MATFTLEGLGDYIVQLLDKQNEDQIWETWLHKEQADSYKDYKKKYYQRMHKAKSPAQSKEAEMRALEYAARFIKPL